MDMSVVEATIFTVADFKILMYLRKSRGEREKDSHLLVHSPKACNILGWAKTKAKSHVHGTNPIT